MRKLVLKCDLAPGDIVMMTAAVRDLHRCYPGQFLVDVRTRCPELWEHNPYLTPLRETDPDVKQLVCSYPLIDRSNEAPYHCLHGFIEFLNERLGLTIKPSAFKGDIHLSAQEKVWYSQVHELTGEDTPFWLICAGGKYDITIKWWDPRRYQEVVDCFKGRIQFVQVGQSGHHHPKLNGVIDLRGKTDLRQLVRLVYHAQGVLCPVTSLMHLAAAVETKPGQPANRACVVVAGGREPAHWEAYPDHQFIHTNGFASCSTAGGCWRDRTFRLRDGDSRDRPDRLCVNVAEGLPRCMDLITARDVIRRIEWYFDGGSLKYLAPRQHQAAELGVRASLRNRYDRQPLTLCGAGLACEQFIQTASAQPQPFKGRGIVLCTHGRGWEHEWGFITRLRQSGCRLPVQLWHLGKQFGRRARSLLECKEVELVNASRERSKFPARLLEEAQLQSYALVYSRFQEVICFSGRGVLSRDPAGLLEAREYKRSGALFWPASKEERNDRTRAVWRSCGLREPREPGFDTRQMVVDKHRCWPALRLALWFAENADFYSQFLPNNAELLRIAFRKLNREYALSRVRLETDGCP